VRGTDPLGDRLGTLSDYARRYLAQPAEEAEAPIRAELFGVQRFQMHGRSLAAAQRVREPSQHEAPPFFPRVDHNLAALREAFDYIALTWRSKRYVSPAAEWLLDNFHLIEAQLQEIREGVPRSYYRRLPKLADAPLAGLPRVYGIAWAYVAHTDSVLDRQLFTAFLDAYQEVDELTLGELWAFPTTLRVVLLENLRRVAQRIAGNKVAREVAHAAWDAAAPLGAHELDMLARLMQGHGLYDVFLTQLWQRMPFERAGDGPPVAHWVEQHCTNGPALISAAQAEAAADNLTVGNIITTLRSIGQVDWSDLIEPVSHSLRVLRQLPSFNRESERTRQQITQALEQMARQTARPEREVAEATVRLAGAAADAAGAQAIGAAAAQSTAGHYLLGAGRAALREALRPAAAPRPQQAAPRDAWRWRFRIYLACIAAGTALVVGLAAFKAHQSGWMTWIALALMVWPVSEAVIALVHRIVAEAVRVHALPRLDFSQGIPAEHRVMVAIPALLGSPDGIAQLAHHLELHWLANRELHAQFALLTDWRDAPAQAMPDDADLLAQAQRHVDRLNALYPSQATDPTRFIVLHRPRVWSDTEQAWIGWERKRGKLEMLLRLLATGDASGFLPLPDHWRLAEGTPYVLTLDGDTALPPGTLCELVATAAHPLNTPQIDQARRRVSTGYGILQPDVVVPFPSRSERSFFHWLFAGRCGIDPYSSGASNVYQDLFQAGTFTGKGLLNVQAVHAVLGARLPGDSVLSHDLLEGSVARCALMTDVMLLEEHPHHTGVAASRVHRWTRGDWQLLPLMLRPARYGLDAIGLWKMADNLRRALVAPAAALLVIWVVFTHALPLGWALAAVGAALVTGPLLGALAGLVPTRRNIELRHFFDFGAVELLRALAAAAWQFVMLLAQAGLQTDAAVRALWRMAVSRRHLLQWTTSAQAQAQARSELPAFLRSGAWVTLAALALATTAAWAARPAASTLFVIWALAPLLAWASSRVDTRAEPHPVLPPAERDYLTGLARDTWRFFEEIVVAEDHHLPPDNLQMEPQPTVAHRTSPTNIGMYLMACCCAREFGWIDAAALANRLEATLGTVESMPRHRGHLYNWYDTQSLQVLPPAYVSAVDSGNLAGHLLCVAQACRAFAAAEDAATGAALERIAARCDVLWQGMDFSGLYDGKRHLFHIGLRVDEMALDASYYDLLASESRLLSFLAIAKGDVPRRHWSALGRPFLSVGAAPGLKSWAGSMFEYLMPALVMPEPRHGLLDVANRAAVQEQQAFGDAQYLPWGVSESAYFAQDHSLAYQYSPFGVPRLALRRTPPTERVVAPYASVMAAPFAPHEAARNLRLLETLGARGDFGFFDAVDFTAARQAAGQDYSVVRNFMAHHQGMSLVALCNLLCADAPRRWFGAAAPVQSYLSLLHERTPRQIIGSADPRLPPEPAEGESAPVFQPRIVDPLTPGLQPTHLLSNGRYTVALRANGAGVSRFGSASVSRWRDDPLRDHYGTFLFVRDAGEDAPGPVVSLTALPARGEGWRYRTRFLADQVQFEARGDGLEARTTVLISPEDDTELRTVVLHNTGAHARTLELISYFEPVLSLPKADEAHPAFANLFIETQWKAAWRALLMARKPRLHGDATVAAAHFVASVDANVLSVECMADRRAFIGRNRSLADPALDAQPLDAAGQPINGLDPIACLRVRLRIAPGEAAHVTFATSAADQLEALEPAIDRYLQSMHVERAARMAATLAQVRLRDLAIDPAQTMALQDLTTILTYTTPRVMTDRGLIDLRQIWRFGISGDKPIVLVYLASLTGMRLVHTLLQAQPWWGFGGVACDLVVVNSEPASYLMPLQREVEALRARVTQQVQNSFPRNDAAGFYLLREQDLSAAELAALAGLARAVFTADGRTLEAQVAQMRETGVAPRDDLAGAAAPLEPRADAGVFLHAPRQATAVAPAASPQGSFDAASGEFRFEVGPGQRTPRPWVNVIANEGFGFQVSEAGAGYTWAGNSRMHQLTPWSNDPVRDTAFEHYLLQDEETRAFLPLTPAAGGGAHAGHRVRHGQGYTVFDCSHEGLALETTFFADREESVKIVRVRLRSTDMRARRLRALAMIEWQMGAARPERRTIRSWKPADLPAVFAQQRESSAGFGGSSAFVLLAGDAAALQWTCDRDEFFTEGATALIAPDVLAGRAGSGLDACGAIDGTLTLAPGASASFVFVLGQAGDADAAVALARRWQRQDVDAALARVQDFWNELLGRLEVHTPDPLFDALVNRWLPYQTLACRMWARAGFYQAGGAFGFRDQLQDAMAFALTDPRRLREQILMNASRQFPEGDVQHWWHMPGGAGVRTHFSDDLLWLPYACVHYIDVSGDGGVLDAAAHFIEGAPIPEGAEDAYYPPQVSPQVATIYEHCARTIDRSLATGVHGLPLMGTGDWNDGMNRVGHGGRGESVWLGWFLCEVVRRFAPIAQARGQAERAQRWLDARSGWVAALHDAGWDGAWFRRAFFDNGAPLGSSINEECRIDLIAQAWSVLSGAGAEGFTRQAMQAVEQQLTDHDMGLLRLLHPPLQHATDNPGYIQAYPPGVRENGGQYSHGAVWALMAQALQGDVEAAWRSFEGLSPAHRARHPVRGPVYEIEPYVMPGDTYGAPPYLGRGGWSWYTGSAAWLHRAAVETLLGLEVRGARLRLTPRVPARWPGFSITLRLRGKRLTLVWEGGADGNTPAVDGPAVGGGEWLDWHALPDGSTLRLAAGQTEAAAT